jgi:putative hemolysin
MLTNPSLQPVTNQISFNPQQVTPLASSAISVSWAKHLSEVRQAQRLRYEVFANEMGAHIKTSITGHDIDLFDDYCEHLLIKNEETQEVIGTYRLLTPEQAKRAGGFYSETEFDLTRLRLMRNNMVELGRSCVHPEHRNGGVLLSLWGALFEFMHRNQLEFMIGCASIPMNCPTLPGVSTGYAAASIWEQVKQKHMAPIQYHVRPRLPLPVDELRSDIVAEPPALIKGYLRLGAKVLGSPAWDPDFNTADLPMMMKFSDMPNKYRKHFMGA